MKIRFMTILLVLAGSTALLSAETPTTISSTIVGEKDKAKDADSALTGTWKMSVKLPEKGILEKAMNLEFKQNRKDITGTVGGNALKGTTDGKSIKFSEKLQTSLPDLNVTNDYAGELENQNTIKGTCTGVSGTGTWTATRTELTAAPAIASASTFKTEQERIGYVIGMQVGSKLKGADIDRAAIAAGVNDALTGAKPRMTEIEIRDAMQALIKQLQTASSDNRQAGDKIVVENAKKDAPAATTAKPGTQPIASGDEEIDWAAAIKAGTDEAFTHFHINHPDSTRPTILVGTIKWARGMHRDGNTGAYILDGVAIGSSSRSISIQEGLILGIISTDDGATFKFTEENSPTLLNVTVLLKGGKIVGRVANGIYGAAMLGDVEKAKALLKDHPDLVFGKDDKGSTPLHLAAAFSQRSLAELLIAYKAKVNAKADDGTTPLHQAAFDGSKGVAELLIANGADVNAKEANGYTPLHAAAVMGHKEVAELLLANKADVNAKANNGNTPLKLAITKDNKDLIELLRNKGGHE